MNQELKSNRDPEVTVTFMKGIQAWLVRTLTPDGRVWMEDKAHSRMDIGRLARSQLRMWNKCGGEGHYADRARHRATEKALKAQASPPPERETF